MSSRTGLQAVLAAGALVASVGIAGCSSDEESGDGIDYSKQCGTLRVMMQDADRPAYDRADAADKYAKYC